MSEYLSLIMNDMRNFYAKIRHFNGLAKKPIYFLVTKSPRFALQSQLVTDDCNELRIRRFALVILDGITKQIVQGFQLAAIPRQFNCMSDCSLHTGVVLFIEATVGYNSFVTALIRSMFPTTNVIASRKY